MACLGGERQRSWRMPMKASLDQCGANPPRILEFEERALVHLDALYRTALRLARNRAEAEDLVQDTCLRAFKNFHQFTPGTNHRAWLFTILRRVFLNGVRRRGRELLEEDAALESASASATAPGGNSPEVEFFHRVLPADVDRALRSLPVVFREAVTLVDLEGSAIARPRRPWRARWAP